MTHKINILKIIFIIGAFFCVSLASAATSVGTIDMSVENKVKVCKDVTCINPAPGIIDFRISDGSPVTVNKEKNIITGKAWGGELGWITFSPRFGEADTSSYGGVSFNPTTGLLKGIGWSETSGAINFSVTGQKVVIDPVTGEWNGWAWASGPYGGWIKFDCKNSSCIRTVWNNQEKTEASVSLSPLPGTEQKIQTEIGIKEIVSNVLNNFSSSFVNLFEGVKETINEKSKVIADIFNKFTASSADLFNKAGGITNLTYNSVSLSLMNLRASLFAQVNSLFR
jgi:hypothetical protein